jgi:hypothetical protein
MVEINSVTKMSHRYRVTGSDFKTKSSLAVELTNALLLAFCLIAMGVLWTA